MTQGRQDPVPLPRTESPRADEHEAAGDSQGTGASFVRAPGLLSSAHGLDAHGQLRSDILPTDEAPVSRIEAGVTVFGKYHVLRKLGEGGMGSVWLVRHLELECERALKTIASTISAKDEARLRFRREAKVMASFSHPNAVTVHDARLAYDLAYIDMEFVKGESLESILQPGVPMPIDWITRVLEQLCDVLQEAHDKRIVHRDLKPSNLMLLAGRHPGREHLKVLDFGIAKMMEEVEISLTNNVFLGTAAYASPEQANGDEVDNRSDLYSVGVLLYQFFCGHRPFAGPVVKQVYDLVNTPPPPLSSRNPAAAVPEAVERLVMRCLAKKSVERPQSAQELYGEFLRALSPAGAETVIPVPRPAPVIPSSFTPPIPPPAPRSPLQDGAAGDASVVSSWMPLPTPPIAPPPVFPAGYVAPSYTMMGAAPAPRAEPRPAPAEDDRPSKLIFGGVDVSPSTTLPTDVVHAVLEGGKSRPTVEIPPVMTPAYAPGEVGRFYLGGQQPLAGRFTPDDQDFVTGSREGLIQVFQNTGRPYRAFNVPGPISSLIFSPDCARAVFGSKDMVRVVNMETGMEMTRFESHREWVGALALSGSGVRVLSGGGGDNVIRYWDVRSARQYQTLRGSRGAVWAVAFHDQDRRAISAGEDGTVRVWDLDNGNELRTLHGHEDWVSAVVSIPGVHQAVSAGMDDVLILWDLVPAIPIKTFFGHQAGVTCAALHPGGRLLASGSKDATIRVWDLLAGRELHCFQGHADWVISVQWSSDQAHLLSTGRDSTARIWQVPDLASGMSPNSPLAALDRPTDTASGTSDRTLRRSLLGRFFGGSKG